MVAHRADSTVCHRRGVQVRVALSAAKAGFLSALEAEYKKAGEADKRVPVAGEGFDLGHGDVVIAAITSCTNTSNPSVLIGAGLVAKKANALGLKPKREEKS